MGQVAQSVYRLWAGQSRDQIPVGRDFPPYNGYRDFPGGRKRPGRDADPSSPSSVKF